MSNSPSATTVFRPTWVVLTCIVASLLCSMLLHAAAERADAAWIVALLLPWGLVATLGGRHLRDPRLHLVFGIALLVRLPLIGTPPLLSDDAYRYIIEGLALQHGLNPFLTPPSELPALAPALQAKVNHPDIPSIYPPAALLWFRILSVVPSLWFAQLLTAGVDALLATTLAKLRVDQGSSPWPGWLYALHPLGAVESASGAHLEPLALLLAIGALALAQQAPARSGALATLAAAVKLVPGILVAPMLRDNPRTGLGVATATLFLLATMLPVLAAGSELFTAFDTYARHWSFNGLFYPWVDGWAYARVSLVAVGVGVAAGSLTRPPGEALAWTGTAFVLLSPTVHPWYVLWAMVPWLALGRPHWAFAAVPLHLSYWVLSGAGPDGSWVVPPSLWWLTWPPALIALAAANRLPPEESH